MPRQTPSEVNIFTQKPNSELEFGSERILFRMNYLQAAVARAAARNWRQEEMAGQEVSIYSTLSPSHWNSPLIKVLQSCVNQREPEQKWGPSQTAYLLRATTVPSITIPNPYPGLLHPSGICCCHQFPLKRHFSTQPGDSSTLLLSHPKLFAPCTVGQAQVNNIFNRVHREMEQAVPCTAQVY